MTVTSAMLSIKIHRGTERGRLQLTVLTELLALFHSTMNTQLFYFQAFSLSFQFLVSFIKCNCLSFKRQRERSSSIHIVAFLISDIPFFCAKELDSNMDLKLDIFNISAKKFYEEEGKLKLNFVLHLFEI